MTIDPVSGLSEVGIKSFASATRGNCFIILFLTQLTQVSSFIGSIISGTVVDASATFMKGNSTELCAGWGITGKGISFCAGEGVVLGGIDRLAFVDTKKRLIRACNNIL